jgi:hypothetical protein
MSDRLEERLNLTTEQLRAIFARPVAYHKLLAIAGGSVGAGVFLSQLIYWTDKTKDPDGWIYKTLDDWWSETALGRYELKTIRNALIARGLIEEKLCGVPARLYYKIEWPSLQTALAKAVITHRDGMSKRGAPANKYVAMPHTGEATDKYEAQPQTTYRTESTTESTKTTESVSATPANGNGFHPVVIVVSSLDGLIEEFGPFNADQRKRIAEYYDKDPDYVLRQAEIVRSEPRANAAKSFLAALRDDWQPRKAITKQKREKRSVIQEPAEEPTLEEWEKGRQLAKAMKQNLLK